MGKGNRNREMRGVEYVNAPKKQKKASKYKKPMPGWLKRTISIAVVVVLVLGIVAAILASNGTFKRWQILVKSKTGEFTVNRQVATFLAWELEYYYAYMSWLSSYYTDPSSDLFKTYSDPDDYAFERATSSLRDDLYDTNGNVVSTPRDIIDDAMTLLINHVAVSDYAYEQGIRLEEDEWKGDLTITWYSGIEDTLPVTWSELKKMQYEFGFSSMDLLLNQIFDTGMKEKDVKAAMELVCMYEKYVATKTEAVEGATTEQNIKDYIKNNPAYFYTTDYLTYQTKDEALKAKLEAVADVKAFKEVIVNNWAETEGNYKKIFNMFVVGEQAEKDYLTIEGKTGDALKEALAALGTESVTYNKADSSNTEKIPADLSKWLFDAKREAGETAVIEADEKYYLLAFEAKNTDAVNNTLTSVTVSQKVYEFADGEKLGTDDKFKSNVLEQLLIDLEISDKEDIEVNYLKAIDKAENFESACEGIRVDEAKKLLDANKIEEVVRIENGQKSDDSVPKALRDVVFGKKLTVGTVTDVKAGSDDYLLYVEAYNEEEENLITYSYAKVEVDQASQLVADHNKALALLMMDALNDVATGKITQEKDVVITNNKIDSDILAAIFDVDTAHPVGSVLLVEKSENSVYLVCIESYDDDDDSKATFSYTELGADAYYEIIEEMVTELEKNVLPKESSAPYTSTPKEGTYQHWMFNGANADNGFKSPIEENAIKVISTEKTENNEKVNVYDIYIVSKPIHLDTEDLVNGGYYVYPESATKPAKDYVESFKGLSGQALINALQKIGVSESSTSVNKATVSETIFRDDLDEKLGDWLFSDDRKANDCDIIEGDDGKTYIAVYLSKTVSWKNTGKEYYVADQISTWIAGLASEYTVNERVLDRIGDPAPAIQTSATTPAAS